MPGEAFARERGGFREEMQRTVWICARSASGISEPGRRAVNIIGAHARWIFSVNGSIASIRQWITDNDMIPGVCLSMGCGIEELKKLKDAGRKLSGFRRRTGRQQGVLEERFGIPYVTGVPFGETFSVRLAAMLKQAAAARVSYSDFREPLSQAAEEKDSELQTTGNPEEIRAVIIGESVFCTSLAAAIELDTGIQSSAAFPWRKRIVCCARGTGKRRRRMT